MYHYNNDHLPPWESQKGVITTAVVEKGVTTLCGEAFSSCANLTDVTLPDTLTVIGIGAFYKCSNLTNITIPEGVTSIDDYAFCGRSSLTDITIPEGVTTIGGSAFLNCTSLTSITIPESVTTIGSYALSGCTSLIGITLPKGLTTICSYTFFDSGLTSITLPEGLTTIYHDAFARCSNLTDVTIPASMTTIDNHAFSGGMTDVYYNGSRAQWDAIAIGLYNKLDYATIHCKSYQFTDGNAASGPLGALSWNYEGSKLDFTFNQPVPEEELVLVAAYDDAGQLVAIHRVTASQAAVQLKDPVRFKLFWLDSRSAPNCWAVTVER